MVVAGEHSKLQALEQLLNNLGDIIDDNLLGPQLRWHINRLVNHLSMLAQ